MRRRILQKFVFDAGYSDSRNPLSEGSVTAAEGSFGSLFLAEGLTRPFKGFHSKGTLTGSRIAVQLGNTWGGLKDYSGVTAQGSLAEDYSKQVFTIGAGKPSKEGVILQSQNTGDSAVGTFDFVDGDVSVANNTITEATHGLETGEQVRLTNTGGALPGGLATDTTYFVIDDGTNTIKLATTWANAHAGTAVDITSAAGGGTHTVTKAADLTASTLLKVATVQISNYLYQYYDQAGLDRPAAPSLEIPTTPGANYSGLIDGAMSFKIAAIRDRASVGQNIEDVGAYVKSIASTQSAVIVPQRKTVKIKFPAMPSGGTHWAVFATKQGFGGTGVHYRIGYRTSSDNDATWIWAIPETLVDAQAERDLEFDFRDGDLYPEAAWIYDYAPPAGTHFLRLETVGMVLGAYDGTIASVSLPNFFESYHPRHLLYFPEPITAILHRQVDDYAIVACRNSIHAVQFVGYRGDDLPAATVTTLSSEVGVVAQHNWATGFGRIVMWVEGAGLVMMTPDGQIDFEFGKEVTEFTQAWTAENVKICFDPSTRSFVAAHEDESVSWSLQSQRWSLPLYLADSGLAGEWLSGINSRGELIVSIDNAGTHTAYSYDNNTSTTEMPTCYISRWERLTSAGRHSNLYEAAVSLRAGANTDKLIIGIHTNLFPTHVRNVSVSLNSDGITVGTSTFTSAWTGKAVCVYKAGSNIGGAGIDYLIGRVTYNSGTALNLAELDNAGTPVESQANASGCFMLVGEDMFAENQVANLEQHLLNVYPSVQDARSFAVSVLQPTDANTGAVFEVDAFGTMKESSESRNA